MSDALADLEEMASAFATVPSLAEMPRRTLADKGIAGPTAAHVVEEVHTPLNLAYVTFTTGSSAFQNIVGVTFSEIEGRCAVARRVFDTVGATVGQRMLVTYPPLANVFSREGLQRSGIDWFFLERSSREAFIVALCRQRPALVLGESSFIRASLEEASRLGLADRLPERLVVMVAGTPLDLDLLPVAERHGYRVHDLYGCQEFGWLTLDGVPLRDDVGLVASPAGAGWRELVVGGLPTADSFPYAESGHVCNPQGRIITYRRRRTHPEYEVLVRRTPHAAETVDRAARTILRIKGRVVKVPPGLATGAAATELELVPSLPAAAGGSADGAAAPVRIAGPVATRLFDDLVQAQIDLQATAKADPAWRKTR